jgi:hypothetical protein
MPDAEDLDRVEASLNDLAETDLAAFGVARHSTVVLARALDGSAVPATSEPVAPTYYIQSATLVLCSLGLRTARAALRVIASGYEPEAHGLKRRLSEIHARTRAVLTDRSGQHARQWLEGVPSSTPRKMAAKFGSLELFDIYSASDHADPRGLHWWLVVPTEDGRQGVLVAPHRRPGFANAILTEIAMELRDLVAAIGTTTGVESPELQELTARVMAAVNTYYDPPGGLDINALLSEEPIRADG